MATDNDITQLCEADMGKGFALLVDTYQQKVYWHIRRLVVSHEDAEDLLQEVFVKSFKNWKSFRGDSSIGTWLYRIATNECITFLNKQKAQTAIEGGNSQELAQKLASDSMTDSSDHIIMALQEAVLKLPEMQRMVFNMRYYDDMSYQDIANVTGSSMSAAKTNYHIAKQKVTEYIKKLF